MRRKLGLLFLITVLAGCSNYDLPTPPGSTPLPGIGVAMTNALTLRQGMSVQATVTVARIAGFTGPIDLSLEGLPVGVTADFSPGSVPQSSTISTLTLSATATAAVGPAAVFLIGKASGAINATMGVTLSVAP